MIVASTLKREVIKGATKITWIMDYNYMDHTSYDLHFQPYYHADYTLQQWKDFIKQGKVVHKHDQVILSVGNCLVGLPEGQSVRSQMKKLIQDTLRHLPWIRKLYISSILPRPDREVEMEGTVRQINIGIAAAVKFVRDSSKSLHDVIKYLPFHKIFIEELEYFDVYRGHTATLTRVIKPVDKNFYPGTRRLNEKGLKRLRKKILETAGILEGTSLSLDWSYVQHRAEPAKVTNALRHAWLLSQETESVGLEDTPSKQQSRKRRRRPRKPQVKAPRYEDSDTDVLDEYEVEMANRPVVGTEAPQNSPQTSQESAIPIFVQGKIWCPPSQHSQDLGSLDIDI